MTCIYKLAILFLLSASYVFANNPSCKDELVSSVASVSLKADHPSMSYHTSIAPGHAKRSLVTWNNSLDRIKVMCADEKTCYGATEANIKVIQKEVDDQVFYSAMGRYQGKIEVGSDIAQNPYVASATDPISGVYSIRHNEFPAQANSDSNLTLSNLRSKIIKSRVKNLEENRNEYIKRSGNVEFFPDGSRKASYIEPTIRNGSDGRHAEVLAASNVLRFKDEIGQCIHGGPCESLPACLKSLDCNFDQWNEVGELYGVKIPYDFQDTCGKSPRDCFPAPPDGGYTPSTLFFDVRGSDHQTITRNPSVKLKKLRINTLFQEFKNRDNAEEIYHDFLTRQTNTNRRRRGAEVKGGVYISSDDADNVISQIKEACNSAIPNPMSGIGRGCHMAYLQSVHEFCKKERESCNPPDIQEARQYVTAKVTGQDTSTPGIQFGAGQRCVHCFHILDGENFHSTLGTGNSTNP